MKLRHRFRYWMRRKLRETYHRLTGVAPPTCHMSTQEWIAQNPGEGSRTVLSNARSQEYPARQMGGNVGEIEPHLAILSEERREVFRREIYQPLVRNLPEEAMVRLRRACVGCRGLAALSSDGFLLNDLGSVVFSDMSKKQADQPFEYTGYLPPLRKQKGALGVLSYAFANQNYFHFLLECLPKLRLFEKFGVSVDRYYVPYRQPYHHQLLELFGIERRKVIPESDLCFIQADDVYFPSHSGIPREEAVQFLYETAARQPWAKLNKGRSNRVYVSRSRMKRRNCLNDDAVMEMLAKYGFERYHLETMSIREQIQLFQQAEIIVGPHGAGLVNMVFTTPGATILEIGTVYRPYSFFHDLSIACGHSFRWFVACAVDGNGDESNMMVDISLLESYLQHAVLAQAKAA